MPKLTPTERFWERVEVTSDHWLWRGAMTAGRMVLYVGIVDGVRVWTYARRFSWALHFGDIVDEEDMCVLPTCGSRSCVRPDHLKLIPKAHVGTQPVASSKRCRDCQACKPAEEFPRVAKKSDGLSSYCTICTKVRMREGNLRKYGITTSQYETMVEAQRGRCAVCGSSPKRGRLRVDHNHETGTIRALLCNGCNCAIGQAAEDPGRLRLMADYLERMAD